LGKALWKQSAFLPKKAIKMIAFLETQKANEMHSLKFGESFKISCVVCYDFVTRSVV
jgi:hypothetical protein